MVVLAALAAGGLVLARKRRSEQLQQEFGPEYDRVLERSDSKNEAESALAERRKRHQKLDLRSLDPNVGFIANMFTNSTINPTQEDGFVYAGFTFFIDAPASVPALRQAVFNAYENLIQ